MLGLVGKSLSCRARGLCRTRRKVLVGKGSMKHLRESAIVLVWIAVVVCVLSVSFSPSGTVFAQGVCDLDEAETQMPASVVAQTADNEAWTTDFDDGFGFDLSVLEDGLDGRVLLTDPYINSAISSFSVSLDTKLQTFQTDFFDSVTAIGFISSGDNAGNFFVLDADLSSVPTSPRIGVMTREGGLVPGGDFQPITGLAEGLDSVFVAMDVSPDGTLIAVVDTLNRAFYTLDLDFAVVGGPFPLVGFPTQGFRTGLCWNSCTTVLIASAFRSGFSSSLALEYEVATGDFTGRAVDFSSIGIVGGSSTASGMDIATLDGSDLLYVYSHSRDAVFAVELEYSLVPGPVSSLESSRGPDGTDPLLLTWVNDSPATYDTIVVRQNGAQIASLPGSATQLRLPDTISGRSQFELETRNGAVPNPIVSINVDTDSSAATFTLALAPGFFRPNFDLPLIAFSFRGMDSKQVVTSVEDNRIFTLFTNDNVVRVISGDLTAVLESFPAGDSIALGGVFRRFMGLSIVTVDGVERLAILGDDMAGVPVAGIFEITGETPGAVVQLIPGIDFSAVGGLGGVFLSDWDADANGDLIAPDLNNNRLVKIEHDFEHGTMTVVAEAPMPQCAIMDCGGFLPGGAVTVLANGLYLVTGGDRFSQGVTGGFLATPFHTDPEQSVQFTGLTRGLLVSGDLFPRVLGPGIGSFTVYGVTATHYDLEEDPQGITFYPSPSVLSFLVAESTGEALLVSGDGLARIFNLNNSPTHPDLAAEQLVNVSSSNENFSTPSASASFRSRAARLDYHYHVVNRSDSDARVATNPLLDGAALLAEPEIVTLSAGASIYRSITDRTGEAFVIAIANPDSANLQVLVGASGIAPGGGGPIFKRGDFDASGETDFTDALRVLGFLFIGGSENPPTPCRDAADADNNGSVELNDALTVLRFLFLGTVQIPDPGTGACGPDPSGAISGGFFTGVSFQPSAADEPGDPFEEGPLGCESYESCDL